MSKSSNSKPIDDSQSVVKDVPDLEAYHSQRLEFTALPGDETGDSNKPPKLTRTQSMKIAASAAADHLKEHKHKYSTCAIVSTAAIIVGCVLGIVAAVVASKGGSVPSREKQLAATKGTSLKRVSPIPAKGFLIFIKLNNLYCFKLAILPRIWEFKTKNDVFSILFWYLNIFYPKIRFHEHRGY